MVPLGVAAQPVASSLCSLPLAFLRLLREQEGAMGVPYCSGYSFIILYSNSPVRITGLEGNAGKTSGVTLPG